MSALPLPAKIDLSTVGQLADDIRARSGADLVLDAGEVSVLGGLGLQILAAAAQSWRSSGHSLTIHPRSDAFDTALVHLGTTLETLQTSEAA
ncbi:hypothetical protein DL1_19885 [Thioclava dalianensis]|uniref:STAS domain-containing protein n=1 Tax=Thioclava dalianensis TaxID=1185766 RepID=A0A074TIQ1_9RHOB|nr:STAS domain-containing protein [Thioclava dalianensis]KEP70045.1 hypothetical protein DL1_19885 [Thioclava dalianensis]SFN52735.1 Anti-anti-sigma regulatory factor (antagonist of anti-sigma factor) [Thioclava dalianensis]